MSAGRIASLALVGVIIVVIAGFVLARATDSDRPGAPAPHAIDRSQ